MNPLDQLNTYLGHLERRLRFKALSRGAAVVALAALVATIVLVLVANAFAFSDLSVVSARVVLFLVLAFALGFGVMLPVLCLNRRRAARQAEDAFPEFEQRLLTFAEAHRERESEAFLELLADDALPVVWQSEPSRLVTPGRIAAFVGAAATAAGVLIWMTMAGPGFLGYGSSLLWAGTPRGGPAPFYDIRVTPGDKTIRRGGDQLVTAQLLGFQTEQVRLYARHESVSQWEEVPMQPEPSGAGFEFLFAGLPEAVDYYVEAGAVQTRQFRLSVVDLPDVERIQVTYRYPEWARQANFTEEDGGDLRAVEGTEADLLMKTDKPLDGGRLVLDDGTEIETTADNNLLSRATVRIEQDGMYHVAIMYHGELVRLTEDYFIEAQQEREPTIRVRRPGRDYRASPIEEVTVAIEAEDDFGLNEVSLRYSVNGGPEQTVEMLPRSGSTDADGSTILYLEDHNLVPGDLVSFYALARDARSSSRTDMFFIEAQPYEREFTQSQTAGAQGAGGGAQEDTRISPRQKEIIAATWNLLRDEDQTAGQRAEDGRFLSDVQSKLKDQAQSLAQRMRSRELATVNEEFESFSKNMESASQAMSEAGEQLKSQRFQEALQPEQKALQHLLRAEAIFRNIQVARGQQGGGGGGGQMGRDLENLFDLELDTEKNQYETGQQAATGGDQSQEIDEAMQRLEELARRQQELAQQQRNQQQLTSEQRWQQEMLRREAEELRRQMEEMARQSSQGQQSQQQQGQSSSSSSSSQQQAGHGQVSQQRLEQALDRLRQATDDMRQANSARGQNGQREADSQRAAERLQEATELLGRLRREENSGQVSELAERADRLASEQREFTEKLREMYRGHSLVSGTGESGEQTPPDPREVRAMAEQKQQMAEELRALERDMQAAVRDLAATERDAASQLREALGEMQQNELGLRMEYLSEWVRRGLGAYAWVREAPVTEGLNRLAEQTRQAQEALGQSGNPQNEDTEQALARVERLRRQMEQMANRLQQGQQGQEGQRGQQGQQGQQGSQGGRQPGEQLSRQGQQSGQGMRGGQNPAEGQPRNFGGEGRTSFSAMNTGEREFDASGRPLTPQDYQAMERSYREGMRDLSRLRSEVRGEGTAAEDITDLIREMQQLDPSRFRGNPELVEQLRTQVLTGLEQLELRLRRELGDDGGEVKSVLSRPVPPGYSDSVAEYFRKLSQGQ